MPIKIGLCGFTIGAAAYVKQFEVVEVQQTFYDPPPAATLERWRTNLLASSRKPQSLRVIHDDDLDQLRQWLPATGERYVMFNNIPRVGDARRFRALLG